MTKEQWQNNYSTWLMNNTDVRVEGRVKLAGFAAKYEERLHGCNVNKWRKADVVAKDDMSIKSIWS